MADGVDIDLYSDDIDPNFQMKVKCVWFFFGFNSYIRLLLWARAFVIGNTSLFDKRRFTFFCLCSEVLMECIVRLTAI